MKKFLLLCFSLAIISCLTVSSYAHPGRTDANGGHTDNSTGEYHYHHGYPAHNHRDMDGDGDLDCPYLFDDKTDKGSSNSISSSKNNTSKNSYATTSKGDETQVPNFVYWIIGILVVAIICMYKIIRDKSKENIDTEQRYMRIIKDEEAKVKAEVNALHKALKEKYGEDYLCAISGAPDGDFFGKDELPHSASVRENIYSDKYTFYLCSPPSSHEVRYHHRSCRYARSIFPVNALVIKNNRRFKPCMLCPCGLPDTSWAEKYKQHYKFLSKYIDFDAENYTQTLSETDKRLKINYRGRP